MIYMRNITITTAKSATYLENVGTHRMGLAEVPEKFSGLLDPAAGVVKAMIEVA